MPRDDLQRLMNAMLVAWLKMRAHDHIAESNRRLHGEHDARRSGAE
jgi:hypothetical protein